MRSKAVPLLSTLASSQPAVAHQLNTLLDDAQAFKSSKS